MIKLQGELEQRFVQQKERLKISNDKFIKKMKNEFDIMVKVLEKKYEEKYKHILDKKETASRAAIHSNIAVSSLSATSPLRNDALSQFRQQDKGLARRHSFGNFANSSESSLQSSPFITKQSKANGLTRRATMRTKSRRKSGASGLRALMGVKKVTKDKKNISSTK